jgi:hypothetical protein
MSFTELNAVEHFIIHQLSGIKFAIRESQIFLIGIWNIAM